MFEETSTKMPMNRESRSLGTPMCHQQSWFKVHNISELHPALAM